MTVLPFAANQPGIVPGMGFFSRAAITNKCTNYSGNPNGALLNMSKAGDAAATLTEVDDIAQLQLAGLYGADRPCANGKVYKLDNSAGTAIASAISSGPTANTSQHTSSVYARGGSGGLAQFTSGSGMAAFPASSSYRRRTFSFTPSDTGRPFVIVADPGQVVFFILNQLVEGPQPGPIIVTAGAAAGVGADNMQVASPITTDEDYVLFGAVTVRDASIGGRLFGHFLDGNNSLRVETLGNGNIRIIVVVAGTSVANISIAAAIGTGRLVAAAIRRGGTWNIAVRYNGTTTIAAAVAAATFTGQLQVHPGHLGGQTQMNAPIEFVGIRKGTFTDAEIIAILQAA